MITIFRSTYSRASQAPTHDLVLYLVACGFRRYLGRARWSKLGGFKVDQTGFVVDPFTEMRILDQGSEEEDYKAVTVGHPSLRPIPMLFPRVTLPVLPDASSTAIQAWRDAEIPRRFPLLS